MSRAEPSRASLSQSPPSRLFSCNSRTKVHAFSTAMLDLVLFSLDFFSTPFRFAVPLSLCLDLLHGCTITARIHCTTAHLVYVSLYQLFPLSSGITVYLILLVPFSQLGQAASRKLDPADPFVLRFQSASKIQPYQLVVRLTSFDHFTHTRSVYAPWVPVCHCSALSLMASHHIILVIHPMHVCDSRWRL